MPLKPKRKKYRKEQKGSLRGLAKTGNKLDFGDFGLQTLERGRISSTQIEAARIAVTRHLKRHGRIWIRMFPDKPVTKKPLEVRMGKGKGEVEEWVAQIKPGKILFEVSGCTETEARNGFSRAAQKLPVRCKFLVRPGIS